MIDDLNTIKFLNTGQLAKFLNISKTSVYRLMSSRVLSFYKVGHNIRFKRSDVLEYLEKNCIKSLDEI